MSSSPLGPEAPFIWPHPMLDDDDLPANSIYGRVPSTQENRNTLTALSSQYNLYFAAYMHRIFVYRLKDGVRSRIPCCPDLQLQVGLSAEAEIVGGYIDRAFRGKSFNTLCTGMLGDKEILLGCCDNGEVLAYYVDEIADRVSRRGTRAPSGPTGCDTRNGRDRVREGRPGLQPFFRANVGKTAWGLAIHQKSRLIGVTSNRAEVTVFAFALTAGSPGDRLREANDPVEQREDVETWVRQRHRNWRIVVALGHEAENLPNFCFLDDVRGRADKICAIDITGAVWVADIWKPCQGALRIPRNMRDEFWSEEFPGDMSRGWGIMAFRENHFMKVDTVEELLGMNNYETRMHKHHPSFPTDCSVDISKSLEDVPGNPCPPSRAANVFIGEDVLARQLGLGLGAANVIQAQEGDGGNVPIWADENDSPGVQDDEEDEIDAEGGDGGFDLDSIWWDDSGSSQWSDDEIEALADGEDTGAPAAGPGPPVLQPPPPPMPGAAEPVHVEQPQAPPPAAHWLTFVPEPFHATFAELSNALGEFQHVVDTYVLGGTEYDAQQQNALLNNMAHTLAQSHQEMNQTGGGEENAEPGGDGLGGRAGDGPSTTSEVRMDMVYRPHRGATEPEPRTHKAMVDFLKKFSHADVNDLRPGPMGLDVCGGASRQTCYEYSLLRTYEKDVELMRARDPGSRNRTREISVVCSNVTTCSALREPVQATLFHAASRLSMVAHMPELCAVVLGSPTGRVVLATLTRMATRTWGPEGYEWDRGMRVDWVLPRASDEWEHRPRDKARPLFGVAVGPAMGSDGAVGSRGGVTPRRYRIMLHYQDHLILRYEITRDEQTRKLVVI